MLWAGPGGADARRHFGLTQLARLGIGGLPCQSMPRLMRLPLTPDMANGLPAAALGIGLRHLTPTRSEMRSRGEQVVDEEIDQLDAYERSDDPPRP